MKRYTVNFDDSFEPKLLYRAKKLKCVKKSDGLPSVVRYIEKLILDDLNK